MTNEPLISFENTETKEKKPFKLPKINFAIKILAVIIWMFVMIKLLIFDIDVYIFNKFFPEFISLLNYKFMITISTVALILMIFRKKIIVLWSLYITLYPFILFFWKIPYFIFKQRSWIFAIACLNSVIAFFVSIKQMVFSSAIFLIAMIVMFKSTNSISITVAIITIFILVSLILINRCIAIFKTSKVNEFYINVLSTPFEDGLVRSFTLDEGVENLPYEELDKKQLESWNTKLQGIVLYNRVFLFMATKLRDYQESRLNYATFAGTIVFLLFFITLSFSLINMGIYKIDTTSFVVNEKPSFFTFIYYSFNNLLSNNIPGLVPANNISQTISMIQSFLGILLTLIFAGVFFSVRSERHKAELDSVIKKFDQRGDDLEDLIKRNYKINSIEEAVEHLEKAKSALISLIYKITDNIRR
ncbi:hypothetical protein [Shouchella miscanthi]|uniref:hypothetical protein n=1 Tax=Shouchella miscanthi TaxID=2598861 RepID=UPI00119CC04C|nr:hypothetical protein [Shouchella miscanthi]